MGDIGPKPGAWNAIDNGFIVFDNVVLSADALLDRYQKVENGKYVVLVEPATRFGRTLGGERCVLCFCVLCCCICVFVFCVCDL